MELAILLNQQESSVVEHCKAGEPDYDNLVIRLQRLVWNTATVKDPCVIGLDEDLELYEVVIIPSD